MQTYGAMSLRGCKHCLSSVCLILQLELGLPSHVTIRNWICKCGLYRIEKEKKYDGTSKWVYIVDESLSIGNQKILLILGVDLSTKNFAEAITMQDTRVLHVEVSTQWKAFEIQPIIDEIKKHHSLSHVLSDRGMNLVNSYSLSNVDFVPDCTHTVSSAIEHIYKKDEIFIEFTALCGLLRRKWIMSKYAVYVPPNQKSKVRFANVYPIVEWSYKILEIPRENLPAEVSEDLTWLYNHKEWIQDFWEIQVVGKKLMAMWKNEGFTQKNRIEAELLLGKCQSVNAKKFALEIESYIKILVPHLEKSPNVLCCSDIIESTFGKFKQKIKSNSPNRMTEFITTIANFGSNFTHQEVKEALEKIKNKDLCKIGSKTQSLTQKKREVFGQKKGKKLVNT